MGNEQSQAGHSTPSSTQQSSGKEKGEHDAGQKENAQWNENKVIIFGLPDEIKMNVLWNLTVKDLGTVCLVCREFNRIATDETLWRELFHRDKLAWKVFSNTGSSATFIKSFMRNMNKSEPKSSSLSLSSFFSSSSTSSATASPLSFSSGWRDNVQQKMQGLFLSEREAKLKKSDHEKPTINEAPTEKQGQISWKQLYLQHHFENLLSVSSTIGKPSNQKSRSEMLMSATQKNLGKPKEKILFFGEGSQPTGKNLLYSMMWNESSPFQLAGLFPGHEGIGSGVGFHIGGREISFVALHLSKYGLRVEDKNKDKKEKEETTTTNEEKEKEETPTTSEDGKPEQPEEKAFYNESVTPEMWKNFFESVDGLIYVLEANEFPLQQAAQRLQGFLQMLSAKSQQSIARETPPPLLVLLCTPSTSVSEEQQVITPAELAEFLVFGEVQHRSWAIRQCHNDTLDGVAEGVHWLVRNMPLKN